MAIKTLLRRLLHPSSVEVNQPFRILLEFHILFSQELNLSAFYQIDKQRKLVKSTATGVLTLADVVSHRENLLNDHDFDPSFSQLIDVTGVADVEIRIEDIRRLSLTTVFSANSRRAFLVKTDVQFGLSRMFGVLRDLAGEKGIRVFRNLDDALKWVLGKNSVA